jgi:hypothetical protein
MSKASIVDVTGSTEIDLSSSSLVGQGQLTVLSSATAVRAALPKLVNDQTFKSAHFTSAFEKSKIPLKGNTVDVKASVNSTLCLARKADSPLFGHDDYDPVIIASEGECWASFELDTLLDTSIAVPLPQGFGVSFEASTAPQFATYIRIPGSEAANLTLEQAITRVLNAFSILDSSDDILSIPPDAIYTSDLSGTVKVGGSWCLPLAVNQLSLADAELPFNQDIAVSPALTVKVKGDIAVTGEFSVRFRRSAANRLTIGLYKKKGTTFEASFIASAGLGANLGKTDLIEAFFDAVAPGVDFSSLQPGDSEKFQKVLKDSLDRSLTISLNAACSAAFSDEPAFVYELDVTAPNQATRDAIAGVLRGDWSGISGLPNAKKIRSVITETVETKYSLNVNLLGLYNYRSVDDFVRSMQVIKNHEDGSVVITDSLTAKQIVTASTPLAADPDRLRGALYEAFLATATYKALNAGTGVAATFGTSQDYLLYEDSMGYRDALKELNAGEVLGVMPPSVKSHYLASGPKVHHARFAASCAYDNDHVLRFYFSDVPALKPRTAGDLKKIGRKVLAALLDPQDSVDHDRIGALKSDQKWAEMDANPAQILPPFYSDWTLITWWASAIADVGPILADTIRYAKTVVGDPTADKTFMEKRAALAQALDAATHETHAVFEKGFPICVMATLAGLNPGPTPPPPVFEAAWDGKSQFSNKPAAQVESSKAQAA